MINWRLKNFESVNNLFYSASATYKLGQFLTQNCISDFKILNDTSSNGIQIIYKEDDSTLVLQAHRKDEITQCKHRFTCGEPDRCAKCGCWTHEFDDYSYRCGDSSCKCNRN